jgi:hypothetical protein
VKTLHYTPFSVLADLAPSLPVGRVKVDAAFVGEVSQVAKLAQARQAKVEAFVKARKEREESKPRVFLADMPLRVSMRERDML